MTAIGVHVPLVPVSAVAPFAPFAQVEDHLALDSASDECHATTTNAAGAQTCIVRTPAKLACVQAAKSQLTPTPPGGGPITSAAGALALPAIQRSTWTSTIRGGNDARSR